MKKLLTAICLIVGYFANSQTYNPSLFAVQTKSIGISQAVTTDARSWFYDAGNFVMRDYQDTTEVNNYLNLAKYRSGHFPIYVHVGGTLNGGGVWIGGTTQVWWYKDSTARNNIVRWYNDSTVTSGFLTKAANLSDLASISTAKVNLSLDHVDNTSDATKNAASVTLTNHTISGSANTLTNIGNSSLTNSTIGLTLTATGTDVTVPVTPASLGANITINIPNASALARGVIPASDWSSFHAKVDSTTRSNDTIFDWHNGIPSFRYTTPAAINFSNNGLTTTAGVVQLGGPLVKNTTLDFAGFNLSLANQPLSRQPYDGGLVIDPFGAIKKRNVLIDSFVSRSSTGVWNVQSVPQSRIWTNLTYSPELRLLVVTSHSGTSPGVMTSPEGINWTTRTTPNNAWRSVAWSPELNLFAAVSSTGTLNNAMTSPDGITWTQRTTPNSYFYRDMVWVDELGLFVAVANTSGVTDKVITSPDGINWTARTCPDRAWSDITWSPELRLLCVSATQAVAGDKVMTSPDGINWTLRSTPGSGAGSWEGLGWSGDLHLFVAVNYFTAGQIGTPVDGFNVMTSPDGIAWTLQATPSNQQWLSVDWSPQMGIFTAVCDDRFGVDSNSVMTSTDGIHWGLGKIFPVRDWRRIKWVPELGAFVAVAYYDGSTPQDSLISLNRNIDINQQYLSTYGRNTFQTVKGALRFSTLGTATSDTGTYKPLGINSAGDILPLTSHFASVRSGRYLPTTSNLANLASAVPDSAQYMIVGNVCTVSGQVTIHPSVVSTLTIFYISLPSASTFSANTDAGGAGASALVGDPPMRINAEATGSNKVQFVWTSASTATYPLSYSYTYIIK